MLASGRIDELLTYVGAVSDVLDIEPAGLAFCRSKLALPTEQWNPAPLVNGNDLMAAGLPPGPAFRRILDSVRDAQLVGEITNKPQALAKAKQLSASLGPSE